MATANIDPSKTPVKPNPSGAPPNFINPPSLEPVFVGVGIWLITISSIFVIIRLIANRKHVGRLQLDDILCTLAWATALGYWGLLRSIVADGSARHSWDIPLSIFTESYVKRLLLQQVLANVSIWAVKACILSLFIRIFNSVRWIRVTSCTLLFSLAIFHLGIIVIWCVFLVPRENRRWGPESIAQVSSTTVEGLVLLVGVEGFVVDCVMFAMPFTCILKMQMRTREKIGLVVVFAVAFCSVAAAGGSLIYRTIAYINAMVDPSWVAINVSIASVAEIFGGIMVSCAPGIACFWNNIVSKSRMYSSLHEKLFGGPTSTGSKEIDDDDLFQFAYNADVKNPKFIEYDTNGVAHPGTQILPPEKQPKVYTNFITSAIPESIDIENYGSKDDLRGF